MMAEREGDAMTQASGGTIRSMRLRTGWLENLNRSLRRAGALRLPLMIAPALALMVLVAGCGYAGNQGTSVPSSLPTTATTASASTTSESVSTTTVATDEAETMNVSVYYCGPDEKVWPFPRQVPKSLAGGEAAIEALLEGLTDAEKEAGFTTCIPAGTTVRGVRIADKVATVDLSSEYASGGGTLSMGLRLAQLVFTITQFPEVESVVLELEGQPVEVFGGEGIVLDGPLTRADYEDFAPPILVESPLWGETITSPVRVWGTANVYEAVFQLSIVDGDGGVLAEETVTASSGTGTRGTFDVTVPFEVDVAGPGALVVFVYSAKDGSPEHVAEIPLLLAK